MAGTLYSTRKLALVFGTYTGNATWQNFALVVGEAIECVYIFIVDVLDADFCERTLLVTQLAFAWVGWILKHGIIRSKGVAV